MVKYLFFYLDAVGYKFLEHLPFLSAVGKKGSLSRVSVEPLHQMEFCIFASQPQKTFNYWTWYYLNPKTSPYKFVKIFPSFLDKRPIKKLLNYFVVLKEFLKGNTHAVPIGEIPMKILPNFSFTSMKSFIDKNPIEIKTFFDVLREKKISFYAYEWPIYSNENKTGIKLLPKDDFAFLEHIKKHKDKDLLFVHLTGFDALLHVEGSSSEKIKDYLRKLDKAMEETYLSLNKQGNLYLFAASDHGMVDVNATINSIGLEKRFNLLFFIDSTCLRAWGEKKEIQKLEKYLRQNNWPGKIFTEKNKKECPVNFKKEYSGDLLFIADPGYEIFPNYFNNKKPIKAMHGYDRTNKLDALFISNKRTTSRKRISNTDICPIILKKIGLKIPKSWKGNPN